MMKKYWNRLCLSVLSLMTAWTANAYYVGDGHHYTEYGNDGLTAKVYYSNDYGMWVVDLGLNNSQTYTTLQCDIVVDSELFEFYQDENQNLAYAFTDRLMEKPLMGSAIATHTLTSHIWDSGFLRMVIGSPSAKNVKGIEGTVCFFGLKVKEGATVDQSKEYPVNLTNIVLARNAEVDGKVISVGYYLQGTIADPTYNCYDANCRSAAIYGSISEKEWVNFQNGVATSPWQVDVDLTLCSMTGLGRVAPYESEYNYQNRYNKNSLLYVTETGQVSKNNENVIVVNNNGLSNTESLTVHDDGMLFHAKMDFSAQKASYDRTFVKDRWSTLCLPFSIGEEKLTELKVTYGMTVEELVSFDSAEGKLRFDTSSEIKANHPYIIRVGSDCAPFKDMDFETIVSKSSAMDDAEKGGARMFGTFETMTVDSSEEMAYYGFNSSAGQFFLVGKNATLPPFRACIAIPVVGNNKAAALSLSHSVETSINGVNADHITSDDAIYNINGQKLGTNDGKNLPKGVYIIGGKKKIIK